MTSPRSPAASLPFQALPSSPMFTTQPPALAAEKAQSTALFRAYEELLARVATWSDRLAHDRAFASPPTVQDPPIIYPVDSLRAATARDTRTQTAGEVEASAGIQNAPGCHRRNPNENRSFVPRPAFAVSGENDTELLVSANPEIVPSSSSRWPSATSMTVDAAAAAHPVSASGHAPTMIVGGPTVGSPTTTSRTPTPLLPPWLATDMDAFFRDSLAPAIQARETQLVNTMHDCVQHALRENARDFESREREFDKWKTHFQSKLDRRVAETNALRKEYYKQLLLLRELVLKQRNDPRTLKALDDVIASVVHPTTDGSGATSPTIETTGWKVAPIAKKPEAEPVTTGSVVTMRREKDKWEQRAREAAAECQQLQEQVLVLKQQLEEARGLDGELWFAAAQHGLYERQRILDSVYKSKCTWDQVGDSIVELLNNEMVWEAVEESAYREKSRVSRGLEALILRADSFKSVADEDGTAAQSAQDGNTGKSDAASRTSARRRRSAFLEGSRVIMCRTCNGCGYLDVSAVAASTQAGAPDAEDDSYLRKTLAQVLELKSALEEANTRTNQVEQQLLRTVMEGAQIKETLAKIELARAQSIDSGLQTDLDDEEEVNIDEIMSSYNDSSPSASGVFGNKKRGGRWKQYEHLIVELKHLLLEREAGSIQLRASVVKAQARLVSLQKSSQQEQERLRRELQTLKGSLALAMSGRNEVIEEKQAAVNMLLKSMDRKKSQALSTKSFLLPRASQVDVNADDGAASDDSNNNVGTYDEFAEEDGELDGVDEVKRSEMIAGRYSQAVGRVQQEHEEQQVRLKQAEDELGQESDKKKRTNSIMLGNIAVTMTSHPRDIFKALANTHQELLNYRRSSQRSSALQTDRLLTLTTHLAHLSEELAMVKKRTSAEIEFWKLDCEKLQHANKALTADFENVQKLIEEANERTAEARNRSGVIVCSVCEKHEARLLAISAQLLQESSDIGEGDSSPARRPSRASLEASAQLDEVERQGLGAILLDLENLYSTLSSAKQQRAREVIKCALVGQDVKSGVPSGYARTSYRYSPQETSSQSNNRQDRTDIGASEVGGAPNAPARPGSVAVVAPSNRLFHDSFLTPTRTDDSSNAESFVVHGSALSAPSLREGSIHAHRRKKIVRKVLSEQEAFNRQRAQTRREPYDESRSSGDTHNGQGAHEQADLAAVDGNDKDTTSDDPAISTYVDENGKQVYYVEVEEDDVDDEVSAEEMLAHPEMASSVFASEGRTAQVATASRRLDLSIQIPSPDNPSGGFVPDSNGSNEIDKDPEVIVKLRELVSHNTKARGTLALTNWKILVSHYRTFRDQRRLDFMNDTWRTAMSSGRFHGPASTTTPSLPHTVRTLMQKVVQERELVLDDAIRDRDQLRAESRRVQAQLICGVSAVLTNLSLKERAQLPLPNLDPLVHLDPYKTTPRSPNHSPSRLLYPSTRVNLSEIPKSQQVPTPSFPLPVETDASAERNMATRRPGSPTPVGGMREWNVDQNEEAFWAPSIFENDNRFPQRSVKFVPAGDGEELSLTHSTSPFPISSAHSPAKSPARVGLGVDARRRPTRSAGPVLVGSVAAHDLDRLLYLASPTAESYVDLSVRRPTRPQSSPTRPRFRPSSATAIGTETRLVSSEVRPPERSVTRPSSSRGRPLH